MARAALVTGAARRIGRALALACAEAGLDVAVHHRGDPRDADDTCRLIEARGRRAVRLQADLADADALPRLVAQAREALGPLTLLVNNASLFDDDRLGALTPVGWEAHMAANLRAPVFLLQAFAAQVAAEAPDGEALCVNLLDQRVLRPNPQFFSYTLSKSALWTATRTAAQALSPRVRVNGIGPGPTLASVHQDGAAFADEAAATPLGRAVTAEDLAAALRYLIGARSVTGQMIAVDSGQHLGWRTPDVRGTDVDAPSRPWAPPRTERLAVFMRGLQLEAEIGVHPHERGRSQPLVVDIEADLASAPVHGIADTLNYETLAALARALAGRGHIELVETYAQDLAAAVLRNSAALRVRVRVEKPRALEGAAAGGVEVALARG